MTVSTIEAKLADGTTVQIPLSCPECRLPFDCDADNIITTEECPTNVYQGGLNLSVGGTQEIRCRCGAILAAVKNGRDDKVISAFGWLLDEANRWRGDERWDEVARRCRSELRMLGVRS